MKEHSSQVSIWMISLASVAMVALAAIVIASYMTQKKGEELQVKEQKCHINSQALEESQRNDFIAKCLKKDFQ